MKTCNRLLLFILVCILGACSSPSKLYNHGNYYQAATDAVRKLRSSPDKKENQDILVRAYPMALELAMREINNVLQTNNVTKYDVVINQYERLNRLASEIYTCPKAIELIPMPREFHAELQQTKDIAAEHYYEQGTKALNEHTIHHSRLAYQYFMQANNYVNGYRDVVSKISEALFTGTLHVIVEAPPMPERFQVSADFFYSNLVTDMNKSNQHQFVLFYTPQEAQNSGMTNPNQYIMLDFMDFTVGNVKESQSSQEVKRDSVPIVVEVRGRETTAYTTVKANLTTFRREIVSGGTLRVRIIEAANDRVIDQRTFNGSYVWSSVWGSFTGDDRALSNEQKRLASQQPTLPPPNQDLFIEFTKPIYTQVVNYVQSIYRNYK